MLFFIQHPGRGGNEERQRQERKGRETKAGNQKRKKREIKVERWRDTVEQKESQKMKIS